MDLSGTQQAFCCDWAAPCLHSSSDSQESPAIVSAVSQYPFGIGQHSARLARVSQLSTLLVFSQNSAGILSIISQDCVAPSQHFLAHSDNILIQCHSEGISSDLACICYLWLRWVRSTLSKDYALYVGFIVP